LSTLSPLARRHGAAGASWRRSPPLRRVSGLEYQSKSCALQPSRYLRERAERVRTNANPRARRKPMRTLGKKVMG
jgi:hypothetical protein